MHERVSQDDQLRQLLSGRTEVGKEYTLSNGNDVSVGADGQLVEVVTGRKLRRV